MAREKNIEYRQEFRLLTKSLGTNERLSSYNKENSERQQLMR